MYHEELESLAKHLPTVKELRFWMTFSDSYITHLKVFENIGLTRIDPIQHQGQPIIPIEFLKTLLPEPSSLAPNYTGKTCIGTLIKGQQGGQALTKLLYNVCDHQSCYQEVQSQAISYTTGVPAFVGALMILNNTWKGKGVFNIEQLDPTPFLNSLNQHGLTWHIKDLS